MSKDFYDPGGIPWIQGTKLSWITDTGIKLLIENEWDWFVFCDIWVNREYPFSVYPNADRVPIIVDLGANVGYFSLHAAHVCKKVGLKDFEIYAVEGMSETYNILRTRTKEISQIKTYNGLVGKKKGSAYISLSANHATSSVVDAKCKYPKEKVNYLNLEEILPTGTIDLIKMDIECSEYDFIKNYKNILLRTNVVFVELHYTCGDGPKKFRELMHGYGFQSRILLNRETACTEIYYRA